MLIYFQLIGHLEVDCHTFEPLPTLRWSVPKSHSKLLRSIYYLVPLISWKPISRPRFILFLLSATPLQLAQIHLIGHNLGAHAAGYSGHNLFGLGRITGTHEYHSQIELRPQR